MLENEFYPTPPEVIEEMLSPYKDFSEMTILEPSAGNGNICDFIMEKQSDFRYNANIYCCEIDPDLCHILQGKNYKVIANDFLNYSGDYFFDLIVMNPPFSNGDEHLLKAWEILEEGDVICLLNEETILNPFTKTRQLLSDIIKDNGGTVKYLGDCFSTAERKTNVNVALVRLHKVSTKKRLDFKFENVKSETKVELNEETLKNPIALRDVIGNMVLQYEETKKAYVNFIEDMSRLMFYGNDLLTDYTNLWNIIKEAYDHSDKRNLKYNYFVDDIKQRVWKTVFSKTNFDKYMTNQIRNNFNNFSQHQGCLDFTKENVYNLLQMLVDNRSNIMESAITDVFEIFTQYHKDNRCHIEGWKTNDAYKVNKKIILPNWVSYGDYMNSSDLRRYGDKFKTNYSYWSQYSDIDKCMCYITGDDYDCCGTINRALENKFDMLGRVGPGSFDGTCESQFFNLRFFKKGTLHLEFKSEKLWEQFNIRAAWLKNWLPKGKDYEGKPTDEKGIRLELSEHQKKEDHPLQLPENCMKELTLGLF